MKSACSQESQYFLDLCNCWSEMWTWGFCSRLKKVEINKGLKNIGFYMKNLRFFSEYKIFSKCCGKMQNIEDYRYVSTLHFPLKPQIVWISPSKIQDLKFWEYEYLCKIYSTVKKSDSKILTKKLHLKTVDKLFCVWLGIHFVWIFKNLFCLNNH